MAYARDLRALVSGASRRDFRRLFSTRLTSQFGDGCFQVGLASLFFFSPERQTSAAAVAGAFTISLLPYSVVSPFAGVFLDRWRRRQVLVWANTLRAALVVVVAALIMAEVVGPVLYAVVLACLSVNRFFLAGLSAGLPHVVGRADLLTANSLTTTAGTISALLGAGAGYALRGTFGGGDQGNARVVLVSAAVYATAAGLATRMRPELLGPDDDPERHGTREALRQVPGGIAAGGRHVWERRPAAYALAVITAHRFAYGISLIAVILLFRNYFNDPADVDAGFRGLATVFGASALGYFIAAVITPPVTARLRKQTWIVVCLTVAAAAEAVFVVWLSAPLVVIGALVVGIGAQGSKICIDTLVQESVEDAYRGRVFSFYDVLFNMAFVSACAFAALLVPADGASRLVYGAIAAVYLVAALGYGRLVRRSRVPVAGARASAAGA